MDRDRATERQSEALQRILLALAAMTGLLDAARFCLPPDTYLALLRPLSAAQEAADQVSPQRNDPGAAALLRRRFVLLCRAIDGLRRRLSLPAHRPFGVPDRKVRVSRIEGLYGARRAIPVPDTS